MFCNGVSNPKKRGYPIKQCIGHCLFKTFFFLCLVANLYYSTHLPHFFFWFSRAAYYIRIKVFRVCGQSGVLKTQYSVICDKNGQGPWGQIDEMKKNPQHIWSGVLVLYDIRPNKTTVIHHWTLIDKRRGQKRFLGRRRNADEKIF